MQEGLEKQADSGELFQEIAQKAAVGVQECTCRSRSC